jgi:hypothetical protein
MNEGMPPSPLRLPLSVVLGLAAPPLGLVAWILLSGSQRGIYLQSPWVRAGGADLPRRRHTAVRGNRRRLHRSLA